MTVPRPRAELTRTNPAIHLSGKVSPAGEEIVPGRRTAGPGLQQLPAGAAPAAAGPADAAMVGDEISVAAQITALFDAGATDVWAAVFPVGDDRAGSRRRTTDLLKELVSAG